MPFVENAFKHVSQGDDQQNNITIALRCVAGQILFTVSNSVNSYAKYDEEDLMKKKGIGLKNVRRRLDLVYPNQYDLKLCKTDTTYTVTLHIGQKIEQTAPQSILSSQTSLQS